MTPERAPSPADDLDDDELFDFEEVTDPTDPAMIRANADFAAGRYLTNDQVRGWLRSWTGSGPLPPYPRPWLK